MHGFESGKIGGEDQLRPTEMQYLGGLAELPRLKPQEVREAAASIKVATAIGVDAIHHRWLLWLSNECRTALVDLFMAIEAVGHIPAAVRLVLLAFLPNLEEGFRPIGILPTVVRVWARARSSHALAWEERCARD